VNAPQQRTDMALFKVKPVRLSVWPLSPQYHMVTAHRLLTHCFPAVWAGLTTGYVASGAGLRMQVEVQRFAQRITTRFSAPERSEGEKRSDESTPLLGTNQIQLI
jgi:hypothetical protein